MKWLAVWLLLTTVYVGTQVLCRFAVGTAPLFARTDLAYLLAIPLAQLLALAALTFTSPRRYRRQRPPGPGAPPFPPPAGTAPSP